MIPTTPRGTRTCRRSRPFGRVEPRTTSPTGSGSAATSLTSLAMARTRSGVRVSRSTIASSVPDSLARSTSSALARTISWLRTSSASATASSASSLAARGSGARSAAAALDRYAALTTGERLSYGESEVMPRRVVRARRTPGTHPALRDTPGPGTGRGAGVRGGSERVDAHPGRGRRPVPLGDALVVRVPVDDLQADDLPRRQLRARPVLAPEPQRERRGVAQVPGLLPVPDLGVVDGVPAGEQERVVV